MAFLVEPFGAGDRSQVIDHVLGIQRGEFGVPITLDDQPDLDDVPAFYGKGRGGFWVARAHERVVGTIGLLDHGSEGGALRKMFVAAEWRGREHGVGAALLAALIEHARAQGVPCLRLGTRPEMHAAHRFYEKHGFVRIAPSELPASFPRMPLDTLFYRLDLVA
ncbi:MAG: GNAT family N-acetyltransferase [Polyangiales bacterium]